MEFGKRDYTLNLEKYQHRSPNGKADFFLDGLYNVGGRVTQEILDDEAFGELCDILKEWGIDGVRSPAQYSPMRHPYQLEIDFQDQETNWILVYYLTSIIVAI